MRLLFEAYRMHNILPDEIYSKEARIKKTILAFQRYELELEHKADKARKGAK